MSHRRFVTFGAMASVAILVTIFGLSQFASGWISKSQIAVYVVLAISAGSLLGCAYFLPRTVAVWWQTWKRNSRKRS